MCKWIPIPNMTPLEHAHLLEWCGTNYSRKSAPGVYIIIVNHLYEMERGELEYEMNLGWPKVYRRASEDIAQMSFEYRMEMEKEGVYLP